MKNYTKYILFLVSIFLIFGPFFDVSAHDDYHKKRHRYQGESQKFDNEDHDRSDYLKPVTNQTYKETCGDCHFAYQPELLPSVSWLKILNQLPDHFGQEIEIKPETIENISNYLKINGAENSSAKRSVKIMRSIGNQVPLRITDIYYIRKKHHELDPAVFKRESIGSLANCTACHIKADQGSYDDDYVKIPK
jgi:hypothetical protein